MFTGLVTDCGRVDRVLPGDDLTLEIETGYETGSIDIGASIACSGVCLTVVDKGEGRLVFNVSEETLAHSTLADWREGALVNLERSLRVGDELGGHLVSGHVDGVGELVEMEEIGGSRRLVFRMAGNLARFVAKKGSIAVDGVSLTVNEVGDDWFEVNIVPHTRAVTAFRSAKIGGKVNLEIDVVARYLDRLSKAG